MRILISFKNQILAQALKTYLSSILEGEIDTSPMLGFSYDIILFDKNTLKEFSPESFQGAKKILIDDGMMENEVLFYFMAYKLNGVLGPETNLEMTLKCFHCVLKGEVWISKRLVKKLCGDFDTFNQKELNNLTPKEKEVIRFLCAGLKNKEIAERLKITERTVKSHLNKIFSKLKIKNRTELIRYVVNSGLPLEGEIPSNKEANSARKVLLKIKK
jgi:DNA-binding CsgD family transcriptional regulator